MFIEIANFICNIILCYSLVMFYLYVYGDGGKVVHKWKFVGHWSLKAGFIWMIIGTAFNLLTVDIPSFSQFVLNVGLTFVFLWAYLFHRKLFKSKKTTDNEKNNFVKKNGQDTDHSKSQRQRVYEVINKASAALYQNGKDV